MVAPQLHKLKLTVALAGGSIRPPLLASESADTRRGRPAALAHVRHVAPVPVLMPTCCVPRGMRRDGGPSVFNATPPVQRRAPAYDVADVAFENRSRFVSAGTRRCRRISCPSHQYSRNRHLLIEHFWSSG